MEILIEHYRLGMKLSMPITVGDKTLLDADGAIENERTLDLIKSNGVKKVDVKKTYLKELSEKYPEFYQFKNERMAKAVEKGTEARSRAAEFIVKARKVSPKPPAISILAKPMDLPELEKTLVPYFQVETSSSRWREVQEKLKRSKVIVIWVDGFTEEEQRTIHKDAKKNLPDVSIIAVYRQAYTGQWDCVKWMNSGISLFCATFLAAFPSKEEEFGLEGLSGAKLSQLKRPFIQLVSDGHFDEELSDWMEEHSDVAVSCEDISETKFNPASRFALIRVKNDQADLPGIFAQLKTKGFNVMKMVVIPNGISKEEVEGIKALGRVFVMIGGIANPKLTALIEKIKA